MIEVKTKSGFIAEVNENKVFDFRFLEQAVNVVKSKTDADKFVAVQKMMDALLGGAGKKAFLQYVAEKHDGIADIRVITNEFNEIVDQCHKANHKIKN